MNKGQILLLGDINIDTIFPVSEFPIPGRDGIAKKIAVEIGGAVVNSAILLDNLDQSVSLIGCVGNDIWSEIVLRKLTKTNIHIEHIQTTQIATTGLTFIITIPNGEKTMFSCRGANTFLEAQHLTEEIFQDAKILHISGYALLESPQREAVWQAVELAQRYQVKISLDTGLEPVMQRAQELQGILPLLSICITGLQEVQVLLSCDNPEKAAQVLISQGVELVAIKLGKEGCFLADKTQTCQFPAFPIKAVDTTGAGDSFSAGLLFSWMHGLSLHAAAVLANAAGAMATMASGAGFALPDRRKVLAFLARERQNPPMQKFSKYFDEVQNVLEGM